MSDDQLIFKIGRKHFYLVHDLMALDLDPAAAGFDVVIFGHSHLPEHYEKEGIPYFNPGSAGPKRHKRPVSVGRITVNEDCMAFQVFMIQGA